jgi:hypothetical protein
MSLIDTNSIKNYINAFSEFIYQNFSMISLLTGLLLLINNTLFIKRDIDKKKNVEKNKKYYTLNVIAIILLTIFIIYHCLYPYLPASYKNIKQRSRSPTRSPVRSPARSPAKSPDVTNTNPIFKQKEAAAEADRLRKETEKALAAAAERTRKETEKALASAAERTRKKSEKAAADEAYRIEEEKRLAETRAFVKDLRDKQNLLNQQSALRREEVAAKAARDAAEKAARDAAERASRDAAAQAARDAAAKTARDAAEKAARDAAEKAVQHRPGRVADPPSLPARHAIGGHTLHMAQVSQSWRDAATAVHVKRDAWHQHPVDKALEHGGQAEVPHREDEHQGLGKQNADRVTRLGCHRVATPWTASSPHAASTSVIAATKARNSSASQPLSVAISPTD